MKKKYKNILLIILIIISIIIALILLIKKPVYNRFDFPPTITVNNHTNHKYADTIAMVIVNKIFNYDTITINIFKINNSQFKYVKDYIIYGHIIKNNPMERNYSIFLVDELHIPLTLILSHELIHLDQFEKQELMHHDNDQTKMIYLGDIIDLKKTKYFDRLYEVDAFNRQGDIRKKLHKLLYKKQ